MINCKGRLLSFSEPVVMGILNITPDSFYTGFLDESPSHLIERVAGMIGAGATIIDIGGQSTRPGSNRLDADAEAERVIPVVNALHHQFPELIISIDTYHSKVAELAVENGASIVNDISAGELDANMIPTVAKLGVPYICMHMKGVPETMQDEAFYVDVTREVIDFFLAKTAVCQKAGIKDCIIDPGFGFGKLTSHNFLLLKELDLICQLGYPVLAGLSRKGMIWKSLQTTPEGALNGTTAANMIALMKGASILRVHDVKEAIEAIVIFNQTKNAAL